MPSAMPRMFLAAAPPSSTSTCGDLQLDLPREEWRAGLDLLGRRRAVAGRAPIDGVGDVDMLLAEPDRVQHAVEQLPGASDEGLAAEVLVAARRLADQHDARLVAAALEAQALRRALERAALEGGDHGLERGKRAGLAEIDPGVAPRGRGGLRCRRARPRLHARRGGGCGGRARQSSRPAYRRSPRRRPSPHTRPIRLEPSLVPLQSFRTLWRFRRLTPY